MHHDRLMRMCARALDQGAQLVSAIRIRHDVFGDCIDPRSVVHFGRPEPPALDRMVTISPGKRKPLELEFRVRCNKCKPCSRRLQNMWRHRAVGEVIVANFEKRRTWFATLTCSPAYLYRAKAVCEEEAVRTSTTLDGMSAEQQFHKLDSVIYRDIQRWFKRLRFGRRGAKAAQFIYLCVTEAHRSGEPHYHLLITETNPDNPLLKAAFRSGLWPGGYAAFKLVSSPSAAGYVVKYLRKQGGRVRASKDYGLAMERRLRYSDPGGSSCERPEESTDAGGG